jgi:hypothetical protein
MEQEAGGPWQQEDGAEHVPPGHGVCRLRQTPGGEEDGAVEQRTFALRVSRGPFDGSVRKLEECERRRRPVYRSGRSCSSRR